MNWLAHLLLAAPEPRCRLASLLPDLVRKETLLHLGPELQRELTRHHRVDAFTDAHPIVRRSVQRIEPPYRRFGGIIIDVLYDHFLAKNWETYSAQPLTEFVGEFYDSLATHSGLLPSEAQERLRMMKEEDWLCSYRTLAGIATTLSRIGRRFRKPFDLRGVMPLVEREYVPLQEDFSEFFPQLIADLAEAAEATKEPTAPDPTQQTAQCSK